MSVLRGINLPSFINPYVTWLSFPTRTPSRGRQIRPGRHQQDYNSLNIFLYSKLFLLISPGLSHRCFLASVEDGLEAIAGTKSCEYGFGPRQTESVVPTRAGYFDTICFNSLLSPGSAMRKLANREIPQDLEIRSRWRENIQRAVQCVDKRLLETAVQDSKAILSIIEQTVNSLEMYPHVKLNSRP